MNEYNYDDYQDKVDDAKDRYADMMSEESMSCNEDITNVETYENADGSMRLSMDLSPSVQTKFVEHGLRYLTDSMIEADEMIVDDTNSFSVEARTIVMTNEMTNILFHFGCIAGLREGMKRDLEVIDDI